MKSYIFSIIFFLFSCGTKPITSTVYNNKKNIIKITDYNQNVIEIKKSKKAKIFITLDPECPLSKSYSKKINQLFNKYSNKIDFYNIFTPQVFSKNKTIEFINKAQLQAPVIIDTNHIVTNFIDAKITPECFLLDSNLHTIYRGLIDDWVKGLGRTGSIDNNFLEDNINLYLDNQPIIITNTKAIGCIIQRL